MQVISHPDLGSLLKSVVLSVNLQYLAIDSVQVLKPSDEIAFIPAISGG
jgi:molybdopterin converting factor small subunit